MLLTILLAASLQSPAALPADTANANATRNSIECRQTKVHQADKHIDRRPDRLIDQPPGGLYLTVVRRVGRCEIPTLIRDGYGAAGNGASRR
jgi:hypothetical protein